MEKKKYLLFVWAFFLALLLIAVPSAIELAPKLIGKSYIDTEEFKGELDGFYNTIGPAVLNPIDREEAAKKIPVSTEEIERHRNYYGSLSEQIADIQVQYENRINEVEAEKNKVLKESLIKERDEKIADIEKNFESDDHVEEKIRREKSVGFNRYLDNIQSTGASHFPIAYKFTDVDSGETFSSGNVDIFAAYQKVFDEEEGLLKAYSIPNDSGEWPSYGDEAVTLEWEDLYTIKNPVRKFEGVVVVAEEAMAEGYLGTLVADYNKRKYMSYFVWILGVLSAVALFTVLRFKKEWVTKIGLVRHYDKLKIDVKAAALFMSLFFTIELIYSQAKYLFSYYSQDYTGIWTERISWLLVFVAAIALIAFQVGNTVERWKEKGVFERDIAESYTVKFIKSIRDMFLKTPIGLQIFILIIGLFLAGIGLVGVTMHNQLALIYLPLLLFVGLPVLYVFIRRVAYLNRIIVATEAMAEGRFHKEIKVEGRSPLAAHARNLNNLREGVRLSMSEQAKSERLKTELITNVSHDLRTPLTSIITYTDLLKTEDLSLEDRLKYVDILDKKSQRLKTLIEDLFEVSKMASGNLELNKNRVDLTQLLQQTLAEHEEEILKMGLDFRTSLPESALVAHIDGKRWWRVLDNLIVNAIKYTMPGTRVYITLHKIGDHAEFVIKNITKYELDENADELFERFKRADTSRHTDGSGLGLAIAQSIVDMHDGTMKIEVDGDLFKVTVTVPASL